jgi:methylase of polypeptide subunit release factors
MLQKAISDPGYKVLRTFLEESRKYLKENGFLLFGFSNLMGDIKRF